MKKCYNISRKREVDYMKNIQKSPILFLFILLFLNIIPFNTYSDNKEIHERELLLLSDFESNTFEGWSSFGNKSKISVSSEKSHSGNISVVTSDRISAWSGPALNITDLVTVGTELEIQAYVIGESSEDIDIRLSAKSIDTNGKEIYNNINSKIVNNKEWKLIKGTFLIPEDANDLTVYFETEESLRNFRIDDIRIYGIPKNISDSAEDENMKYNFGFESSLDGWISRGDISIVPTSEFSYTGKYSLYVSGRKDFWNAPMIRLNNIDAGVNYNYSAYVMYNGATYENNHDFVIKLQYIFDGEEVYSEIAGKTLQKGTWSRISGDFIIPDGAEDIFFYIQTADVKDGRPVTENDIMSFYVDNVVIFDSTLLIRHRIINCIIIISVTVIIMTSFAFISFKITKKIKATKEALRSACIDTMTQAYNRNAFEERIKILESSPKKCRKFYFTVCDVNFLKYINDNYGHESGDKAIIRCSEVLMKVIGKSGKVYRTGGDEFVCITKSDFTKDIKTEFLIEASKYKGYPFSVAVGTAHYDKSIDFDVPSTKIILARSDKEMYNHKQEIKKFTKEFQHESQ